MRNSSEGNEPMTAEAWHDELAQIRAEAERIRQEIEATRAELDELRLDLQRGDQDDQSDAEV